MQSKRYTGTQLKILLIRKFPLFKVIEFPVSHIRDRERAAQYSSIKINDDYMIASLNNHPEVLVWNANNFEFVDIFLIFSVAI